MEDTNINTPEKDSPQVKPKTSKVNTILKTSKNVKKQSSKLRRVFEKGIYQKKTQLSVLKRYKRRLDAIEKEDELRRQRLSRKKVQLPDIKKFAGNFFSPKSANDPLKAVGALAAFNAATKAGSGDVLGAIGPGLIAGGAMFGPALLGAGANKFFNRGSNIPRGFDKFGRRVSKSTQERYLSRYGEKAFKNRFGGKALARAGNVAGKAESGVAKLVLGRLGKSIIPGVSAYLNAQDAKEREKSGDIFGSKISSLSSALSGTAGAIQLLAAGSALTGIGLPAAGILELISVSSQAISFGLDVFNLIRDVTGDSSKKDKLTKQTKEQKKIVSAKKQNDKSLTFSKTLDTYGRVVTKFEQFSKGFSIESTQRQAARVEDLLDQQRNELDPMTGANNILDSGGVVTQYLTGDPSYKPGYDPSHGGSNYHDHIAFRDRQTAIRAYNFFRSKNIDVTEFTGFGAGVTGSHSGRGSLHHRGLAFDIPGYQWGGRGAIGSTEYRGSARVRALLNEFLGLSGGGRTSTGNYDIIIPLDHVRPENSNKVSDLKGGNTFSSASQTGADGRERIQQDRAAAQIKAKLQSMGFRVKIVTPENFGNYEDYDKFIKSQSTTGAKIIPLHFDAATSKGGTGFLTRVKPGDRGDANLASSIQNYLSEFQSKNPRLGGIGPTDTQSNRTLNLAGSAPATLVEMGSMTQWEQVYGKNFPASSKFQQFISGLANTIGRQTIPASISPTARRTLEYYPSYTTSPVRQQIIPIAIPSARRNRPQQPIQQVSTAPMITSGPSEQDLLNSFYKRVLLLEMQ